jgi:hypothetical protein
VDIGGHAINFVHFGLFGCYNWLKGEENHRSRVKKPSTVVPGKIDSLDVSEMLCTAVSVHPTVVAASAEGK